MDVTAVTINGASAEMISNSAKKGMRTWKVILIPAESGICTIEAFAYDESGNTSAPITQTVTINPRGKATK